MTIPPANILLLCAAAARHTGTVDIHIRAFEQFSRHNVLTLDSHVAGQIDLDLSLFDAIVFHYSIVISLPHYLSEVLAKKIEAFSGPKILFIQDEFRWVDRTAAAAKKLGVNVLFTVVNEDVVRKIYRDSYFDDVRFEITLTGFVPEDLLSRDVPPYQERPLDIVYRARKLPAWCGSFALQKWQLGEAVDARAKHLGLVCDIEMSEASRIYGEDWIRFLSSAKATLGSESGASFVDYTGLVHQEIDAYEARNPLADFPEIADKFLEGRDNEVVIHVISPRVFEAAALRTLMIMYPGTYSGVVQPGRHYLELARDHSNMDEVLAVLKDPRRAQQIIDAAYQEVACAQEWTHKSFIEGFDRVVGEELSKYEPRLPRPVDQTNPLEMAIFSRAPSGEIQEYIDKKREFDRLRALNASMVRNSNWRMSLALALQRARTSIGGTIARYLPAAVSQPLLRLGFIATERAKPILKRMLLR